MPAILIANANFRRGSREFKNVTKLCTQIRINQVSEKACAYFTSQFTVSVKVPEHRRSVYGNQTTVQLKCPRQHVNKLSQICRGDMRVLRRYIEEIVTAQVQGRRFRLFNTDQRISVFDTARDFLRQAKPLLANAPFVSGVSKYLDMIDGGTRRLLRDLLFANYCHEYYDPDEDPMMVKLSGWVYEAMERRVGGDESADSKKKKEKLLLLPPPSAQARHQIMEQHGSELTKWLMKKKQSHHTMPTSTMEVIDDVATAFSDNDIFDRTAAASEGDLYLVGTINRQTRLPIPQGDLNRSFPQFGSYWVSGDTQDDRKGGGGDGDAHGSAASEKRYWNVRNPQHNERLVMSPHRFFNFDTLRKKRQHTRTVACKMNSVGKSSMEVPSSRSYLDARLEMQLWVSIVKKSGNRNMQSLAADSNVLDAERLGLTENDMTLIFELEKAKSAWTAFNPW